MRDFELKDIELKPLPTVIIALLFGALFALAIWANGREVAERGPEVLKLTPSGNLIVNIQQRLYKFAPGARHLATYDLTQLRTPHITGDIAFYPNGDLLIRLAQAEHSLFDNLLSSLRLNTLESERPDDRIGEGLHRCDLQQMMCEPLPLAQVRHDRAFALAIDQRTRQIYYANTTGHTLHRFSAAGTLEASVTDGLIFPNRLVIHEGSLYLANTNRHRVSQFPLEQEPFGTDSVSHRVDVPGGGGYRWPFSLQPWERGWVVNLMQNGMRDGRLARFDTDWAFVQWVELPPEADPIDLVWFDGELLVSDYANNRIHRIGADGTLLGEFRPDVIDEQLRAIDTRRGRYQLLTMIAIGLIIASFIGGILFALLFGKKQPNLRELPPLDSTTLARIGAPMEWMMPRKFVRIVNQFAGGVAILVVFFVIGAIIYLFYATPQLLQNMEAGALIQLLLVPAMFFMFVFTGWLFSRHIGVWAIRIVDHRIELRHRNGALLQRSVEDVIVNTRYVSILIEGIHIPLRNLKGQSQSYDTDEVNNQLIPRLRRHGVTPLKPWPFSVAFWRQSDNTTRASIIFTIALFVATILVANFGISKT